MTKWKTVKLGDVCEIKHGWAFLGSGITDIPNGHVLVTPGNFKIGGGFKEAKKFYVGDYPEEYLLHGDDLVVTMTDLSRAIDTLGYSALIPTNSNNKYLHNQRIGRVILTTDQVDKFFLYWLMRTHTYQRYVAASSTGTTVKHTSPKVIKEYSFPCPPLSEQRRIAAILGCLDAKIELNRRMNANLESQAAAIFKSWFVDFEPFKNKKFVDSPLGLIPNGWAVGKLTDIADFKNGLAMQKRRPQNGEPSLPVLKIRELRQGYCDSSSELCSADVDETVVTDDGDVIFSWSGSLLVRVWCGGKCGVNQHLFKVTSVAHDRWFYYFWTLHHLEKFIKIAEGKATTMGHIQRRDLEASLVVIPDKASYEAAAKSLVPLIDLQINKTIESRILATIRDTLLAKLMRGEV